MITGIICLIGVYFFIKNNSKNYLASIYVYITMNFFIFLFSGLRQAIAISIVLMSIEFIKNKQPIKFALTIIFASMFHTTALIFLPAIIIAYKKINKNYIKWVGIISIVLLIIKQPMLQLITQFIYKNYTISQTGEGYNYLILLTIIVAISLYIRKYFEKEENEKNLMFYNFMIVTIPLQILATVQGNIARLVMYFSISLVILIPNIIQTIEEKGVTLTINDKQYSSKQYMPICKIVVYGGLFAFFIMGLNTYPEYNLFFL